MGFLNQSVLQQKAAMATVEKHPLLKECDAPLNVRQAYLQGCVLAVLEGDDGKVSNSARQELAGLGLSLELSNDDISETITSVSGINSPEAQEELLGELFATLSGDIYPRHFMKDFEQLLTKGGAGSSDFAQTIDYFGSSLTGKPDWRSEVAQKRSDAKRGNVVVAHIAELPNCDIRSYLRDIPFHLEYPDGGSCSRIGEACKVYSPDVSSVVVELITVEQGSNDWIENASERAEADRRDMIYNRFIQQEDTIIKFRQALKDAIPGLVAYENGLSVHWVLPDTEYRARMMRLPCGYRMNQDKLGRAIIDGYSFDVDCVCWDEMLPFSCHPEGFFWNGMDGADEVVAEFLDNVDHLYTFDFNKGDRMRLQSGEEREVKTYGDVYQFIADGGEFI